MFIFFFFSFYFLFFIFYFSIIFLSFFLIQFVVSMILIHSWFDWFHDLLINQIKSVFSVLRTFRSIDWSDSRPVGWMRRGTYHRSLNKISLSKIVTCEQWTRIDKNIINNSELITMFIFHKNDNRERETIYSPSKAKPGHVSSVPFYTIRHIFHLFVYIYLLVGNNNNNSFCCCFVNLQNSGNYSRSRSWKYMWWIVVLKNALNIENKKNLNPQNGYFDTELGARMCWLTAKQSTCVCVNRIAQRIRSFHLNCGRNNSNFLNLDIHILIDPRSNS